MNIDDETTLPSAIKELRRCNRWGYVLLSTALLVLLLSVPHTLLWSKHPHSAILSWWSLVIITHALAVSSYFLVQGSDPGYIFREGSQEEENFHNGISVIRQDDSFEADKIPLTTQDANDSDSPIAVPKRDIKTFRGPGGGGVASHHSQPLERSTTEQQQQQQQQQHMDGLELEKEEQQQKQQQNHKRKINERAKSQGRFKRKGPSSVLSLGPVGGEGSVMNDGEAIESANETDANEEFCRWCDMAVPLRSHHCRICQRCVATFDHHCGVINTCVGEKNHCRFVSFVVLNFLAVWLFSFVGDSAFYLSAETAMSDTSASKPSVSTGQRNDQPSEIAYVASVIFGILWWYLVILSSFQLFFVFSSGTSYECIKGPDRRYYSAYNIHSRRGSPPHDRSQAKYQDIDDGIVNRNSMTGSIGGDIEDQRRRQATEEEREGDEGVSVPLTSIPAHTTSSTVHQRLPLPAQDYGVDPCDMPFGSPTRNLCANAYSFCCLRDALVCYLRGRSWRPHKWTRPKPKPPLESVEICDNWMRNKHYSCC